jgi:hypothetical protein
MRYWVISVKWIVLKMLSQLPPGVLNFHSALSKQACHWLVVLSAPLSTCSHC